eukprot:CAMPEP_0178396546 /NCGR_PEP_ID=MMETSP0689_2-20121128/13784_1 /TAXON_ID=160604 /ORGANISM="Amphidinium massartii, Strain CS-259" /LENGTH=326 /DNA_ID=CAMNT_0020017223 /DNA_START=311 /DNA_END=1288 /DNA_ORIENTATION=+
MKGKKGVNDCSLGQDNFCVALLPSGWEVVCVFDGHGPRGEWPAMRAAKTMPHFLATGETANLLEQGRIKEALTQVFSQVELDLEEEAKKVGISLQCCGSTALCAVRNAAKNCLWVATAGDSRGILLAPGRGLMEETSDHKPTREDECSRVLEKGARVINRQHPDGFVERRVYNSGGKTPGLCVTRSFGDLAVKSLGISAEPEVWDWSLSASSAEGALLLAATDGIWEFIDSATAAEIVLSAQADGLTAPQVVKRLVDRALLEWHRSEGEDYSDDITVLLIPVHGAQASRWQGSLMKASICSALTGAVSQCCKPAAEMTMSLYRSFW